MKVTKELDISGQKLVFETGELAGHASGSVLVRYGETVVLATAVSQKAPEGTDFFPLTVDYEERLYAGGRISTSRFIKREGRPSEESILTSRLIDRAIRPLFPKDYQASVQIIVTVLSIDQENDPDIISLIGASAALAISDIPWNGPLAGVRVASQNGGFILNPQEDIRQFSDLDLVLATTKDEVVMIEAGAKQVPEEKVVEALKFGLKEAAKIVGFINDFVKEVGKPKQEYKSTNADPKLEKLVISFIQNNLMKNFDKDSQDEGWFDKALEQLAEEFIKEDDESKVKPTKKMLSTILEEEVANRLRTEILVNKKRPDGRSPDEIRPLNISVGVLPRTHGSAIFQRGETQVLSIVTLGSPSLGQLIEGMEGEQTKRYMHHYNFPPFSSGEVRRAGSPGRREIGHGALAEKALRAVVPPTEQFPYTIRVVSEVLSSAGSTSMASTCGSTLALMDAGVPLIEPVAGISIGLITDKKDKKNYVTICDIAYQEDSQGDMDFKVTGTKNGITAIQMDIKLDGVGVNVLKEAFEKARKSRLFILDKMLEVLPQHRGGVSKHAPTVLQVKIAPSKIGEVIGSGGRVINNIIATTGCAVDIDDSGTVTITGTDVAAAQKAAEWVEGIVKEAQVGEIYEGTVKRILPFGAMIEILPGKEGLVHISKLAPHRVERVEDVVKIGQEVKVRVVEIDDQHRVNLSMNFGNDQEQVGQAQDRGQRQGGGRQYDRNPRGNWSRDRRDRKGPRR
ncbi:MAG TPA: polyribonucleotide nucleotidyltransferase [Patescibacteria group bacterium]